MSCGACVSCCDPCCDPCKTIWTCQEMKKIAQCPTRDTKCITVQYPPKLINKKKVIYEERVVKEPRVSYECKKIVIPEVVWNPKLVRERSLYYVWGWKIVPKVCTRKVVVKEPEVRDVARIIYVPKEVCVKMICTPEPQVIAVPPPIDFICTPTGPHTVVPFCKGTCDDCQKQKESIKKPPCPGDCYA